jgi:TetR/AcrR family transcriptional regulator
MPQRKPKPNQHDRSDQTRQRILQAAIGEFSAHGLAGARTDSIAQSAQVNKALLYYYFKNKEALYTATIEDVMGTVVKTTSAIFEHQCSPGEQLLRLTLNHFDRILTQHDFQNLMQQEMVRFRAGKSTALPIIARTAFDPLLKKIQQIVQQAIHAGEIVQTDWMQIVYSAFGANVFYFLSAPMMRMAFADGSFEPFTAASIASRRTSALTFLGNALFTDRAQGAKLVRRVLTSMPMPEIKTSFTWRKTL